MKFFYKPFLCLVLLCMYCFHAQATAYYCDPATGNMANSGSFSSPWSTLQAVFAANKSFSPGDTIFLRNGYHGLPQVKGLNSGYVTIQPQNGHVPTLRRLTVLNAKNWIISGLKISPAYAGLYEKLTYVTIAGSASFITLKKCDIFGLYPDSIAAWIGDTVRARMGDGLLVRGRNCLVTEDTIRETYFALQVLKSAPNTVISNNLILHFGGDAMRGLGDSCNFEYNKIFCHYRFPGDLNHPDAFQSWSLDSANIVGADTVRNVVIRGNTIINLLDPNQPFANDNPTAGLQGISNFDGFSKDWLIENNLVVTNMWHGIALYGAVNCKIINNTVMPNYMRLNDYRPWIAIVKHKNGSSGYGNVMMNNLVFENSYNYDGTTRISNILSKDTIGHFTDFRNFNFHLKDTSAAVNTGTAYDAGTNTTAPATDLDMVTRTLPYDIGAYDYNTAILPVCFQSFTGQARETGNMLQWTTTCEMNNTGFEVLYSLDARNFNKLGFVASKAINGNSTEKLQYGFIDDGNTAPVAYYQLKQLNKDGRYTLSPVVTITSHAKTPVTFGPNPAGKILTVKYGSAVRPGLTVSIRLSDMNGRKVKEIQKVVLPGSIAENIDVSALVAGIYFLEIIQGAETLVTAKLVKL